MPSSSCKYTLSRQQVFLSLGRQRIPSARGSRSRLARGASEVHRAGVSSCRFNSKINTLKHPSREVLSCSIDFKNLLQLDCFSPPRVVHGLASPRKGGMRGMPRRVIKRFVPRCFKKVPRSAAYNRLVADLGAGQTFSRRGA